MFELNEGQEMVQKAVRDFADRELAPMVEKLDSGEVLPYDLVRRMMKALGIGDMIRTGLEKRIETLEKGGDKEARSSGKLERDDPMTSFIIMKELARQAPGYAMTWGAGIGLCGGSISSRGTAEQLRKYAIPVMTFEKIGAWALTEPGAGSDAFGSMKTTAVPDGDDYILNGSKTFITNAPHADVFVIYAKLDKGQEKKDQLVHSFILERGMEGLTTGQPFKKMGMRDSPTGEVFMEDVRVPRENLLGGERDNLREAAKEGLGTERTALPAMALGIIEKCYELSVKYAKERVQFQKPIGQFQAVQLRLANMYILQENVRNAVYRLAWMAKNDKPDFTFVCAQKAFASRAATQVALEAIDIHGGYGYMQEYHVEKLMRDAKLLEIGAGTTDINLMQVAKLEMGY